MAPAGSRGDRLPPAPRERRPALAALAVLLIVGGAAVAGLLALRADNRVPVLALARDVAAGAQLTEDDLTTTPVASEGTLLVPAAQQSQVLGRYARVGLTKGQLLDTAMLTKDEPLQSGQVAVGAALAAGRVPASGLQPGDIVQLVSVAEAGGTVLVDDARVSSTRDSDATGGSNGSLFATFILQGKDAPDVAAVAAAGDLSVVLVKRGQPIDGNG